MLNYFINKIIKHVFVLCCIPLFVILVITNASCALMPRTVLDSDSGEIIESTTVAGRFKIHLFRLDQYIVAQNSKASYVYKFGSRDQVTVYVWGHPEFSSPLGVPISTSFGASSSSSFQSQINNAVADKGTAADAGSAAYTIDENGNVFLPLIGMVKFESRTINQVRKDIAKRLTKYVINPQVSIRTVSFRSKVTYVLGEVTKPTAIYLNDTPLDLSTALSYAGWVNLNSADVKNIYVMRLVKDMQVDVYRLDATNPTALLFASEFVLKPSDVVFVSTAGVAQFNRVITQFLNAAQVIWFSTSAVNPNGIAAIVK